ncbi:MAG: class C sortase [Clostridiales bacterium]|nr:class C sortase [Clostridiales bacterium]MDD7035602.1 class C sortase [Bacillota bacterium]
MKNSKKKGGKLMTAGLVLLFAAGLLVMLYPMISDLWNRLVWESVVSEYADDTDSMSEDELREEWEAARRYNTEHKGNVLLDPFEEDSRENRQYKSLLNPSGNGVMGYIEIPEIDQRLVIYHGTSEAVLEKGCGHIAGTSLPVGGKGTHAVIAAHRGLPTAKLFTDLDQLKKGDRFYLFILDKTLAYEVDQIKVVKPDCLDELQIQEDRDLVTLFTCTPYSVNTHRLLVRGHRVKYEPDEAGQVVSPYLWLAMIIAAVITLVLIILLAKKVRASHSIKS